MSDASRATDWPPQRVAMATLVVVAVLGVFLLLYFFSNVFFLLLIGIVLAIALNPAVAVIQRFGASRVTASIVVYLALGTLLFVGAWFGLPSVYWQMKALVERLPHSYLQLRAYLEQVPSELVSRFAAGLPPRLFESGTDSPRVEEAINVAAQLLSVGGLITHGIYLVMAIVLLAFYWSLYEERTILSFLLLLPQPRRGAARELIDQIETKLGAYLRAQGLLCLIMGFLVLVAYWLIGVPYALALAVAAGILEALPVFGPVLAAIPALLVALSVSTSTAAWVLGAVIVLQQIESNLLVPRMMDRSVGVNAIVTLLAIAGLSALWGLSGAILAIPIAAVAQLALDRWVFRRAALDAPEPSGRDAVSLLRFQIRELLQDVQIEFRRKRSKVTERSDRLEEALESLALDLDLALLTASTERAITLRQEGER
ncbi:MAG TPA: AI-2E family transporter [Pirellulales bacterium]|nr:AI-2E family transporter [Pirellulales bacterium]